MDIPGCLSLACGQMLILPAGRQGAAFSPGCEESPPQTENRGTQGHKLGHQARAGWGRGSWAGLASLFCQEGCQELLCLLGPGWGRWRAGFQTEGGLPQFLSWNLSLSKGKLALHPAVSPGDISRELLSSRDWEMWPLPPILSLINITRPPPCLSG